MRLHGYGFRQTSGYGNLTKGKDEEYTFHKFDEKGNELVLKLIEKTQKRMKYRSR